MNGLTATPRPAAEAGAIQPPGGRSIRTRALRALRALGPWLVALLALLAAPAEARAQFVAGPAASLPREFMPRWADSSPRRLIKLALDPRRSAADRGAEFVAKLADLQPGDELRLSGGTYQLSGIVTLDLRGEEGAPIRITAVPGERVVLTRADAAQNVLNIGTLNGPPARYVVLSGLEITGGSQGLRLLGCRDVWIDRCHIHRTGEAGLTANSRNTSGLVITRNEISHTRGTGEGMYLGANHGAFVTSGALIALNHVHHTGGSQGDGIELKQGSFGNRIVSNHVHHTRWPAIIVYGTGGRAINVIERNFCHDSGENILQVQGEALVANNLLVRGLIGIHSHDHQGKTRNLRIVHNTIITSGPATDFTSWNGRPGMVFANNAVYSFTGPSLSFPGGTSGVQIAGNVIYGSPAKGLQAGFVKGRGLSDFVRADWRAGTVDATPSASSALRGAGDKSWAVTNDLLGQRRTGPLDAGCLQSR